MVDLILFDFSKAFDLVNHDILLTKLSQIGIGGSVLLWIREFLRGRTLKVVVGGEASPPVSVGSGVPQSSVLGPTLFLFYIFITPDFSCKYKIFADDLKIYLKTDFSSSYTLHNLSYMQRGIDLLVSETKSWRLKINTDKTVAIRFCRGPHPFQDPFTI